ncbi:hypothetical protein [Nonomuraea rhodomycinica]|uniref:HEAT repeat-containing protein n=1 Tax=Nonomuraea rhodomycinica TaxID=1712872 RepID=A0A7Y6MES3_9ACTN|nr:hypothetical protein [Nonomuraea rhodomycinica]NUW45858.1 hypothetical protein [Nonomuraea rhodomycinica]
MLFGLDALENYDWSCLVHAYGQATDTPDHLRRLVRDDDPAWEDTIVHLHTAVTHQGSVYPATAPVATVVAGLLQEPRFDRPLSYGWQEPQRPVRAHLLDFLAAVAESTEPDRSDSELWSMYHNRRQRDPDDPWDIETPAWAYDAVMECRSIAPALVGPVLRCLSDGDPRTRVAAISAAAALCQVPTVSSRRSEIVTLIEDRARNAATFHERAEALETLDHFGGVSRSFLFDRHPGVRLVAAFSSSLAHDPDSSSAVWHAVTTAEQAAAWYADSLMLPATIGWPNHLLHQAVRRVTNFAELLPTAVVVATTPLHPTTIKDLELLLERAFPEAFSPGDSLDNEQRTFLRALLDNSSLWESAPGEASQELGISLALVGFPADHASLSAIVGS